MKKYNWELEIYDIDTLYTVETYCKLFNINYAYALHDKDIKEDGTPKKSHVHFMIFFPCQRTASAVSKELGVPLTNIEVIDNKVGAVRYLTHIDCKDENGLQLKYLYSKDIIVSNFDIEPYFNTKKDKSGREGMNVLQIIEYIKQKDHANLEDVLYFVINNNLYADFRRNQNIIIKFLYSKY